MKITTPAPPSAALLSTMTTRKRRERRAVGKIVLLIGSFAPVHLGHLELINNATNWLINNGRPVRAAVVVPNSEAYVANKLSSSPHRHIASLDARLLKMESFLPHVLPESNTPVIIDDVSCRDVPDGALLNVISINSIIERFGCTADDILVVLGSDQLKSMQPYWHRTECVVFARPGYNDEMYSLLRKRWVQKALRLFKLSIVDRPLGCVSMSSTQIRDEWSMEIKMKHLTVDTVIMKVIRREDIEQYIASK